jgi:hypothetical protein
MPTSQPATGTPDPMPAPRARKARRPAACGTPAGYKAHRRRGEPACAACKAANAKVSKASADKRRATNPRPHTPSAPKRPGRVRTPDPVANAGFIAALAAEAARGLPPVPDVITDAWWQEFCAQRAQERPSRLTPPRAPHQPADDPTSQPGAA